MTKTDFDPLKLAEKLAELAANSDTYVDRVSNEILVCEERLEWLRELRTMLLTNSKADRLIALWQRTGMGTL